MDKKDKFWLRALTIAFALLVLGLAYFGWQLGQNVQNQNSHNQVMIEAEKVRNDQQEKEIDLLKAQVEEIKQLRLKEGPAGKDGADGKSTSGKDGNNGKDGVTRVEYHNTQTIVQNPLMIEPLPGINGRTPEFAINGETNQWLMRYEGDDEWRLVPVLCKTLSIVCKLE